MRLFMQAKDNQMVLACWWGSHGGAGIVQLKLETGGELDRKLLQASPLPALQGHYRSS